MMGFKVGDKLKCVGMQGVQRRPWYTIGEIYEIVRVHENGKYDVTCNKRDGSTYKMVARTIRKFFDVVDVVETTDTLGLLQLSRTVNEEVIEKVWDVIGSLRNVEIWNDLDLRSQIRGLKSVVHDLERVEEYIAFRKKDGEGE